VEKRSSEVQSVGYNIGHFRPTPVLTGVDETLKLVSSRHRYFTNPLSYMAIPGHAHTGDIELSVGNS